MALVREFHHKKRSPIKKPATGLRFYLKYVTIKNKKIPMIEHGKRQKSHLHLLQGSIKAQTFGPKVTELMKKYSVHVKPFHQQNE